MILVIVFDIIPLILVIELDYKILIEFNYYGAIKFRFWIELDYYKIRIELSHSLRLDRIE